MECVSFSYYNVILLLKQNKFPLEKGVRGIS